MWFDPAQLTKTKSNPLATSATSATFRHDEPIAAARVARIAKVAADRAPVKCSGLETAPFDESQESQESQPRAPMNADEAQAVRAWLKLIEETDPATIANVLERCGRDPEARTYFLGQTAAEPFDAEAFEERAAIAEFDGGLSREDVEALAWYEDDMRRCAHCLNHLPNGICKVAAPGMPLVSAMRGYRPDQSRLHRCAGYRPCPDDPDQRLGIERWPGLVRQPEGGRGFIDELKSEQELKQ